MKNKNYVHFSTLLKCHVWDYQKYIRIMLELREVYETRFQNF
jgi:hypothetical protein